jgi:uncharacterized SAM-binding protein YcdF (DUF218 family)
MSLQEILTALLLPPLVLVPIALIGVMVAGRGRRWGLGLAALAGAAQLLLATPLAAGMLMTSLERTVPEQAAGVGPPGAIIVLGGDAARSLAGADVGALTLERLRAGAALSRRTGLPLLVTAGPNRPGEASLAAAMARSLETDFGAPARWVEEGARDTRDNAVLSAAMLLRDGIRTAHLVTHAWHMPRAMEAFGRAGLAVLPAPVRLDRAPDGRASDWLPRADRWGDSWFALREWAGRLVYALRD